MWRQHTQRLPMILSDSLLGVEIFDLMIRVDSKQNVGNISLDITKIKLLITVGPTAEVLIASVILLQIVRASDISRKKKANFRGIFRGKFAEKSADFAGFSREKSQNSWKNRPISRDFRGRKVKIRRKIGRFRGILVEKSQILKDFQGQILRKIGQFHGKFRGETSPRNNQ